MGFRDVTRATDERTLIATVIPRLPASVKFPTIGILNWTATAALVANFGSLVLDFAARQKVGGISLSYYIFKQLPILPPCNYTPELLNLIVPKVVELIYTAYDIAPFARDCGYNGPPFVWDEERRAHLRAELDGIYAHLYGLSREDFDYILDTFNGVRDKDIRRYGEYRTKRLVLEAYDRYEGVVSGALRVVRTGV